MLTKIVIVGAGPAGLFCAYELLKRGYAVDLYDQQTGVGKKFLVAGGGGLNLTHSEELDIFSGRYGKDKELFRELLEGFSPNDLRQWCQELEVETFIGTSGRIFPTQLKAAQILSNWLSALKSFSHFRLFLKHSLIELTAQKKLTFQHETELKSVDADFVILALGGASWERTGSDGKWKRVLESLNIEVKPFQPMNCGFEVAWSEIFKSKAQHTPLKNIVLHFEGHNVRAEMMITNYGVEGGAVYALSHLLRNKILDAGHAELTVDLKPDLTLEQVRERLKQPRAKKSFSTHLQKCLKLNKSAYNLWREVNPIQSELSESEVANSIKNLKIKLTATRPLSEAISTAGGVSFDELSSKFELHKIPGVFVVGEMLDFEAPTGGYLLQGCFSSAWRVINSFD